MWYINQWECIFKRKTRDSCLSFSGWRQAFLIAVYCATTCSTEISIILGSIYAWYNQWCFTQIMVLANVNRLINNTLLKYIARLYETQHLNSVQKAVKAPHLRILCLLQRQEVSWNATLSIRLIYHKEAVRWNVRDSKHGADRKQI